MRKLTVLLSFLLVAMPAIAKTSTEDVPNAALHEQCRTAIQRETPFTTEIRWSTDSGRVNATAASFEEMNQARSHAQIQPLQFLNEAEFAAQVSWREATAPKIANIILNDYSFSIAQKRNDTFIQVAFVGKTCGAWEVTKKPE